MKRANFPSNQPILMYTDRNGNICWTLYSERTLSVVSLDLDAILLYCLPVKCIFISLLVMQQCKHDWINICADTGHIFIAAHWIANEVFNLNDVNFGHEYHFYHSNVLNILVPTPILLQSKWHEFERNPSNYAIVSVHCSRLEYIECVIRANQIK